MKEFIQRHDCSLLGAALLGIGLALLPAGAASALTLKTQSVQLPTSTEVFPGDSAGAKAANTYCLMCHSAGMVMNQPDLPKSAWLVEVNKMKNAFKAPIPEDQVSVIADYLDSIKGKK